MSALARVPRENSDDTRPAMPSGAPGVLAWIAGDRIVVDTAREMVLTAAQALAVSTTLAQLARVLEAAHRVHPH